MFDNKTDYREKYCIDELIEQKMLQMKLTTVEKTKHIYTIAIVLTTVFVVLIAIVQMNSKRIGRLVQRYLPESEVDIFVRWHEVWKIQSYRLRIDYDRCLGEGMWSNIYFGTVITISALFNINCYIFD